MYEFPVEQRSNDNRQPWTREVYPTLVLALPIMAGMVSHMLMGLTDTLLVGRVGVIPLAAASFVNTVTHPPMVFAIGLLVAVAVLTAQAFGGNQPREAGEILRYGLLVAAGAGVLMGIGFVLLRPKLSLLGQPPEVIAASHKYYLLFGWSILPALIAHAAKQFSEALNHAWMPNGILLGGVALNALLAWALIFGHFGLPALGLEGAGWATMTARIVTACAMLYYTVRSPALKPYLPVSWTARLDLAHFKKMIGLGSPVAAQHLLEVSAFAFAALMMGWISAEAMAAHQIALTCAATTFMFALGLGMAISIRVGQAYGSKEFARVRTIGFVGLGISAFIMGLFGIGFAVARYPLARLFVESPQVITLTTHMFIVAALFQLADGVQVTAISALRGLSDVRVPACIAILAYWIIAVPVGYAFGFHGRFGAVGIWIGLAVGLAVAGFALSWRFHRLTEQTFSIRT